MANIARFGAFDDAFDNLLRGFFVRPIDLDAGATPAAFRVDLTEDEKAYALRAEIPGVTKDDINITIEGDRVAIGAEVKNEKRVAGGERVLRAERYYGKIHRAFALGQEVDEGAAQAKYADGVLYLTLPKKIATPGKRITIN